MNTVKIQIHTGRTEGGTWYAVSPDIPWLATEGDSYSEVLNLIKRIAPVLAAQANIHDTLQLVCQTDRSGWLQ